MSPAKAFLEVRSIFSLSLQSLLNRARPICHSAIQSVAIGTIAARLVYGRMVGIWILDYLVPFRSAPFRPVPARPWSRPVPYRSVPSRLRRKYRLQILSDVLLRCREMLGQLLAVYSLRDDNMVFEAVWVGHSIVGVHLAGYTANGDGSLSSTANIAILMRSWKTYKSDIVRVAAVASRCGKLKQKTCGWISQATAPAFCVVSCSGHRTTQETKHIYHNLFSITHALRSETNKVQNPDYHGDCGDTALNSCNLLGMDAPQTSGLVLLIYLSNI